MGGRVQKQLIPASTSLIIKESVKAKWGLSETSRGLQCVLSYRKGIPFYRDIHKTNGNQHENRLRCSDVGTVPLIALPFLQGLPSFPFCAANSSSEGGRGGVGSSSQSTSELQASDFPPPFPEVYPTKAHCLPNKYSIVQSLSLWIRSTLININNSDLCFHESLQFIKLLLI